MQVKQSGNQPFSLSLNQYRDLISDVPMPSQQQKESFAEYVAHAHSWYKHLPRHLPGTPFYFYIDKYAAYDRVLREDGSLALVERAENGFHYSELPTEEYRARFGCLAFSCARGTSVMRVGNGPVAIPRDKIIAIPGKNAQLYALPAEVLDAGRACLTAVIHAHSASIAYWDEGGKLSPTQVEWPIESGGQAVLGKIFDRCREMRERSFKREKMMIDERLQDENPELAMHLMMADPALYEFLVPERRRQLGNIVNAVGRVCALALN